MRASLVLGLGGTGSWVAAHMKQRMLTDQRWGRFGTDPEAPSRPNYDAIDLNALPVWVRAVDIDAENRPVLGRLTLEPGVEDIRLESPVGQAIEHFKSLKPGQASVYPTIERWLPADEIQQLQVPEATKFMQTGAGQIRQLAGLRSSSTWPTRTSY